MRDLLDSIRLHFDFKANRILNNLILKRIELSILLFNSIRFVARNNCFRIVKRRAIRVYNKISINIKKKYDDNIFLNALIKNVRRVVRICKNIK